jgi:hypothetical protein
MVGVFVFYRVLFSPARHLTHRSHHLLQILCFTGLSFLLAPPTQGGKFISPASNASFTRSNGDSFAVLASLNLRRLGDRFATDFAVPACDDFQAHTIVLGFPSVALVKVGACMEKTV